MEQALTVGFEIADALAAAHRQGIVHRDGRKAVSASTLGRATTTARGVGRTMREAEDVKRAAENADVLKQQLADLGPPPGCRRQKQKTGED